MCEGKYLQAVDVSEKFREVQMRLLCVGERSLKHSESMWVGIRRGTAAKIIKEVVRIGGDGSGRGIELRGF